MAAIVNYQPTIFHLDQLETCTYVNHSLCKRTLHHSLSTALVPTETTSVTQIKRSKKKKQFLAFPAKGSSTAVCDAVVPQFLPELLLHGALQPIFAHKETFPRHY